MSRSSTDHRQPIAATDRRHHHRPPRTARPNRHRPLRPPPPSPSNALRRERATSSRRARTALGAKRTIADGKRIEPSEAKRSSSTVSLPEFHRRYEPTRSPPLHRDRSPPAANRPPEPRPQTATATATVTVTNARRRERADRTRSVRSDRLRPFLCPNPIGTRTGQQPSFRDRTNHSRPFLRRGCPSSVGGAFFAKRKQILFSSELCGLCASVSISPSATRSHHRRLGGHDSGCFAEDLAGLG